MADLEKNPLPSPPTALDSEATPSRASTASGDVRDRHPSERRGMFHRLVIIHNLEEPKRYERKIKWLITIIVAGAAVLDPLGTFTFWPALRDLSIDLHVSSAVANLSTGLSFISPAIFPLWWSSLSETFGRRAAYIVSLLLYLVFNILSAKATSIGMLITTRLLSSGASASVMAVGAGTIADIWDVDERGTAVGIYFLGILATNGIGPVIGGALTEEWGWRATQWFLTIYGTVLFASVLFCLPETHRIQRPVSSKEEVSGDNQNRNRLHCGIKSKLVVARHFFLDPLRILAYVRYPAIIMLIYLASVTWGTFMFLCVSVQQSFSSPPYDFSALAVGLTFLPLSMGLILASILGGRWSDYVMTRSAKRAGRYDREGVLTYRPEDRLQSVWLSMILCPGALIWYGWAIQKGIQWITPLIAIFLFGAGSMLIFGLVTTMLTEFVPSKAASIIALNSLGRNIIACVCTVAAQPLISAVGNGWLFSGLAVITTASAGVVYALKRFGARWREEMAGRAG